MDQTFSSDPLGSSESWDLPDDGSDTSDYSDSMDLTTYYCYDCDTRHDVSAGAAPFLCNTRDTSPKFVRLGDYGYATMPYRQVSAIISPHAGDADNTGNADNQGNTGNRSPPRRRTPPRGHDEASGSSTEITVTSRRVGSRQTCRRHQHSGPARSNSWNTHTLTIGSSRKTVVG